MIIDEFTNDIDFSCLTREQQMDSVAWSLRLKPERSDPILTNQNDLFLNCKVNQYWLSCNILLQKLTNRNLFDGINWYYHAIGFIYLHSVNYKKYSAISYFFRYRMYIGITYCKSLEVCKYKFTSYTPINIA